MSSCAISHIAVSHTWEEMDDGISELWHGAVAQLRLAFGQKLVPTEQRRWLAQLLTDLSAEEEGG